MASPPGGREKPRRCGAGSRRGQKRPLSSWAFKCHPTHGRGLAFLPRELSNPIKRPFRSLVCPAQRMTRHVTRTPVPASTPAALRGSASPVAGAPRCQAAIKLGASQITDNQPRPLGRAASCRKHTHIACSRRAKRVDRLQEGACWISGREMPGCPWSLDSGIVFEEKITHRDPDRGRGRAGARLVGPARSCGRGCCGCRRLPRSLRLRGESIKPRQEAGTGRARRRRSVRSLFLH